MFERRHLPILRAAGVNALVCSIFICDSLLPELALRNALDQISALNEELDESRGSFALCRNVKEARRAMDDGKIAIFLSLEGAEPIGNDLFLLRVFYELGVRLLGITWSRRNYAGDGSAYSPANAPRTAGGLTKFGCELVMKAQELGMVIDVSHLNDQGFNDVAALAEVPFIASHSNCRSICGSARNLTDDQIRVVAKSGGVIGINAYGPFSADMPDERLPEKLIEHLLYIVELVGAQHVCLGLDLCDCVESLRRERNAPEKSDLFTDHADARCRLIEPIRSNFPAETANAILGENFLNVLQRVLG